MSNKILLVEGEGDKEFFRILLKAIKLEVNIEVSTPRNCGSDRDGKPSALRLLPEHIQNMPDGTITHLAVTVDADYIQNGGGYKQTILTIKEKIGSEYTEPLTIGSGLSFPHSDGLNPFGVWVMPNNSSEGMFEDWIKTTINNSEKPLFDTAFSTVANIKEPKFKNIHQSKAEIATWMAWQKMPAQGFTSNNIKELLDFESLPLEQLIEWLNHIYN